VTGASLVSTVRVVIPTPLRSYTGQRQVEGSGATLGELLADLDRRYPGLRFRVIDEQDRIRPHIRLFVGGEQACDLAQAVGPADTIHIVPALSGG
jgi:molybdopterin converting factor small subunit